jgi:hypothetical protein
VRRLSAPGLAWAAGLAVLAVAALVLLLRQERRAPDPLLPLGVLGDASVWRANLLSALVAGAFVGSIAFLPIYFAACAACRRRRPGWRCCRSRRPPGSGHSPPARCWRGRGGPCSGRRSGFPSPRRR